MGPSRLIAARRDRGFVLFMTLVMLVILTISGLAMMQVMGSGVTAAGNIAFRQASVRYADLALEDARTWMIAQPAVYLHDDHPSDHGYISWGQMSSPAQPTDFDPKTHDWTNPNVAYLYSANPDPNLDGDGDPTTFSGYRIYYVIHRLAVLPGQSCSEPATGCMFPVTANAGVVAPGTTTSAGTGYTPPILGTVGNVYYRITAKVVGPRHNSSYVQAIMH
jgi:type IV pilus assembly protein PilX